MISEIVQLIKIVPDVIWSAILASVITLFGVMLSNRGNTARLKLQLDHDATEKAKEKISDLRRDVYLKVSEDIENTNLSLSEMANRDFTDLNFTKELQLISGSIARLRLVAEPKTSILAGNLGVEFGSLFLKLLPQLAVIQDARTDIGINQSLHESSSGDVSRVVQEMNRLKEEGRQDRMVFQNLQGSYEFHSNQTQQYADAVALAYERLNAALREYSMKLFPEMKELSKLQLKVMVAIRADLGIACDVANLQRQLERQWAVMEAGYGDAMKNLKVG
ncbi:hypothetical protein PS645_01470 [Pseudomonas fluorescens]|uniref:Uncharacterized protein n=1 Tax=Pseudomonas fluorescens TaxID=294 RepID=A0A5E6RIN8_PSEFL|nr:hypothetical protein [Pseudomonas fluorescens]VVM64955.1 hypothetical protein PS645_01470 [Pseudomonas fluorescens]